MPEGWISPFQDKLYRVVAWDSENNCEFPVTPAVIADIAEELCSKLKQAIKAGFVRTLHEPHIELVKG